VADRLKQFFLGPANMAKINQLESEYMSRFPSLVENLGSTGVFSDARHAAATSLMSDRLGGIPYVSDTLANLGGGIRELGGFVAEMQNPNLKGSSMEDLRANALAFDYPAGTTAEEIYADIFSKAAARQSAGEFAGTGFQYGQAQAMDTNNLPGGPVPGLATQYLLSTASNSASEPLSKTASQTSKTSDAISKFSAPVDDPTSRLPQVPEQTYMDGIMKVLNPDATTIINRINAANNAQPMVDTSYFSSGVQPAPRSTRFDGFAPRVGRSDQAIFGNELIASRQPRNLTGRDPLAQFDGSPTSEAARLALQNQRNVMRQSIKDQSPSGIETLIGTIVSLATGIPVNLATNLETINRKGSELSRAFAQGLGIPRRETTGMVYDDRGRGYTPGELNRMNAAGGYYSEPARQQRRRERRVEKMLERKAAGKRYSQKNLNRLTTGGSKPGTYTVKGAGSAGEGRGGKSIVCTAMYQTTGLQDWKKAMKIWYIYQKKHLTDTHQEGYHWLFKPFVKAMKKSKIVEALGAHVAKHRTQELKHILFNSKSDKLGKVYNMILEPICFIAGKIKSALGRG
jgi:hypothetical protein